MSLQTGTPSPDGPASQRLGDQMKFKVALWRTSPNPIWITRATIMHHFGIDLFPMFPKK